MSFIPGNGAKFPLAADGEYNLVWWNNTDYADPADDPQVEIVRVVSTVGDVFTILRAQEGTSATNKNVPNKTYKMVLSFTQHVLDEIIAAAGEGTVTGGSSEGAGIAVFDAANSTSSTLFFKSLTAGANVTLTDNGTSVSIASSGGGGGSGYNLFQNQGVDVTQETTVNLSDLLTATDSAGATDLTINVANLAADGTFVADLAANTTFAADLVANATFISDLANSSAFISDLTSNTTFQTNVTSFVGGGNKFYVDTTPHTVTGTGSAAVYTVSIPAGTLGTSNSLRFRVFVSNLTEGGTNSVNFTATYGSTTFNVVDPNNSGVNGYVEVFLTANAATGSQIGTMTSCLTTAVASNTASVANSYTAISEDSTLTKNFTFNVNRGSIGDSVTVNGIVVEIIS